MDSCKTFGSKKLSDLIILIVFTLTMKEAVLLRNLKILYILMVNAIVLLYHFVTIPLNFVLTIKKLKCVYMPRKRA